MITCFLEVSSLYSSGREGGAKVAVEFMDTLLMPLIQLSMYYVIDKSLLPAVLFFLLFAFVV